MQGTIILEFHRCSQKEKMVNHFSRFLPESHLRIKLEQKGFEFILICFRHEIKATNR